VCLYEFETIEDVIARLPHFIEEVYDQKRLHSALDYYSPNDFEELLLTQQKPEWNLPDSPNFICPIIVVQSSV